MVNRSYSLGPDRAYGVLHGFAPSTFELTRLYCIIIIEWCFTPHLTVFQSYHGHGSHYSCLSWISPVLGWGSEVSCPRTFPQKTQRIQCDSNPGPLDFESKNLPLSHAGNTPPPHTHTHTHTPHPPKIA